MSCWNGLGRNMENQQRREFTRLMVPQFPYAPIELSKPETVHCWNVGCLGGRYNDLPIVEFNPSQCPVGPLFDRREPQLDLILNGSDCVGRWGIPSCRLR